MKKSNRPGNLSPKPGSAAVCCLVLAAVLPCGGQDFHAGQADPTFHLGTGANGEVLGITVQPDGKILVVGRFTEYDGQAQHYVARLNPNGDLDRSFQVPTLSAHPDTFAHDVLYQPDGRVLVAGSAFLGAFRGNFSCGVVRFNSNGSVDNGFAPPSLAPSVYTMVLQSDGRILAGGALNLNGQPVGIVRLLPNGAVDPEFNVGQGFGSEVWRIALRDDGKIYVSGRFTHFNGVPRYHLARLNADGSLDTNFAGQLQTMPHVEQRVVVPWNDGGVLVASDNARIVLFNADGSNYQMFGTWYGFAHHVIPGPEGKLLVAAPNEGPVLLDANAIPDPAFVPNPRIDYCYTVAWQGNRALIPNWRPLPGGGARYGVARLFTQGYARPRFEPLTVTVNSDGTVQCALSAGDARTIVIQASTNLIDWTSLGTNQVSNSATVLIDSEASALPCRFYRAWVLD